MAALSAARVQKRQNDPVLVALKMAASTTIYQGGGVMVNSSGLAVPAADTASARPMGVAMETKTSAATGTTYVSVAMSGVFNFVCGAADAAESTYVGVPVYWTDDQTVDLAAVTSHDIIAGVVVNVVSATSVDVLVGRSISAVAN